MTLDGDAAAGLLQDLAMEGGERRLVGLDPSARQGPFARRIVLLHAQHAAVVVEQEREGADGRHAASFTLLRGPVLPIMPGDAETVKERACSCI
jgi:hypothetical protein